MSILTRITDGVRSLFDNSRQKQLGLTGQVNSSLSPMKAQQILWRQMYQNMAPWLIRGKVWSTNLACIASGEVARLVTLDMRASAEADADIQKVFAREILWNIRNQVEYGLAFGGAIIKPFMVAGQPRVNFVHPNEYEILYADTDGTILEIFFKDFEKLHAEDKYLVRVEHHMFERMTGRYTIVNEVYRAEGEEVGTKMYDTQAALNMVPRWRGIAIEQTITGVLTPLFGFFKPATSNSIDPKSPHGVSIFDKAITTIMLADKQLSGLVREFKIKEGRLYVDRLALEGTDKRGEKLPNLDRDFYVKMDVDPKQGTTFFEVFSPEIRTDAFLRTFNKYQQLVEDNIGLMHGTFSAPDITDRTATEVRESKHRTYSTVAANQQALQKAMQDAVNAIAKYMNREAPEVVSQFDDSLLRDPQEVLKSLFDDVLAGFVRPEIYLAKKNNITEAEALKMMPQGRILLKNSNTDIIFNEADITGDMGNGGDGMGE